MLYNRHHPYLSKIRHRERLTPPPSAKEVFHVELLVDPHALSFAPGDSVAIFPQNNPKEVDQILAHQNLSPFEKVYSSREETTYDIRTFLLEKCNLSRLPKAFAEKDPSHTTLSSFLRSHKVDPSQIPLLSSPLLPRFYSIANASSLFPGEIHLLISHLSFLVEGEMRYGTATHFLCHLATPLETPIPLYIQPSPHFTLPQNPDTPILLIGPGTGIAPFRAFLQERLTSKASGPVWLFFGDRHKTENFYYEPFWRALEEQGKIRLSLAFSRDQREKLYVQHLLYQERKDVWDWIQKGAYVYICGDAKHMAKEVDATLRQIAIEEGQLHAQEAEALFHAMRKEKRYLADVY